MKTLTEPKTNEKELRELDAWIAWHVMKSTTSLVKIQEPDISLFSHYSTDSAAAMQVLEKCAAKIGPNPTFSICIREREDDFWEVSNCDASHSATTLPEAICLFAKKLFVE